MAALALCVRIADGHIAECRIVFGGVEACPRRTTSVENALIGSSPTDLQSRAAAIDILDQSLSPLEEAKIRRRTDGCWRAYCSTGCFPNLRRTRMTPIDEPTAAIRTTLNGEKISTRVVLRQSVVDWVRHEAGLTAPRVRQRGVCGACHVIVDGKVVRGCLMLAVQLDGADIVTIEASPVEGSPRAAGFFLRPRGAAVRLSARLA